MYVQTRAQTIIRIFRLIFIWVIFEYQFSDQLFVCYNFVHLWQTKMPQTSFYYPFCCAFSSFNFHTNSEAKQWNYRFKHTGCLSLLFAFSTQQLLKRIFRIFVWNLPNIRISKIIIRLNLSTNWSAWQNLATSLWDKCTALQYVQRIKEIISTQIKACSNLAR